MTLKATSSSFPLIYEDNHLLVVNKSAGLLTQPSGTEKESLEEIAKKWLKEKYKKTGNVFLHVLHRLDKPASGIVVFAKTSKALSRLNQASRKGLKKHYYALVEGVMPAKEGMLENYLVHDDFQARVVASDVPSAKLARLHYHVKQTEGKRSFLEIALETGRYHQIRAQLSHSGCPIIGDRKYGSITDLDGTILLHHFRLEIPHPITGEIKVFEVPLPTSWKEWIDRA